MDTKDHVVDINRTTDVLMPETDVKGGLSLPNKERLLFRIPENKSVLGLDVLARAKKASKGAEEFKVSLERSISAVTSLDEDEKSSSFESENFGSKFSLGGHSHASRRYRGAAIAEASELTNESRTEISVESTGREASTTGSSSSFRTHGHIYHERVDERRGHRRQRVDNRSFTSEKKHRRHEHPPRTPVGFDRGDDRHEWEDTPLRESRERYSVSHRSRYPSRSPMLAGASPDARLVSPYQTPRFAGAASPWDSVAPSPEPIRASGASSKRASGSRQVGKSHQPSFSVASNSEVNDNERGSLAADQSYEITDEMLHEMDYNADREWYDREEHHTMFDSYYSSLSQGDDTFQKKEAELAKRLTRKDGSLMTFAQSKKMSQLTADNAQWEDRQLLRSGAVRGTEVQMEFEDEDERKVILLVHDTKPPFLDGRVVYTKQAEPVMPIKDPTSDMAIISRKGSSLVREIHEKQSMNKSRQRFWELAGSKLGDILGVQKTAEQVDADTAVVGEQGEVDFKEEAKFSQHLKKKGEAVSDFAKSKSISQQRQYLPIYSVREELLQVIRENQVVIVVGEIGLGKTTQLTQMDIPRTGLLDVPNPDVYLP